MKKQALLIGAMSIFFIGQASAQNTVTILKKDGSSIEYPLSAVDTLSDDENTHRMTLSYSKEEKLLEPQTVIAESAVNLDKSDVKQSYNVLRTISFNTSDNAKLQKDVNVEIGESKITLVFPYLTDMSGLKMNFETTGSYVYFNGKKIESGASCDFSQEGVVKVVAFNGDVRTYNIAVINSGLPILEFNTSGKVGDEWAGGKISIKDAKGKESFTNSNVEIKGRGKHFKESLKNAYNLKFDEKVSILGLTSAKRWVLLSNAYDKTMIRSSVAFDIAASDLFSFKWTPKSQPVELILDGKYMGSYTLVEQIRVCEGRVSEGQIFSAENSYGKDDDAFQLKQSGMTFIMRDPETGVSGTKLMRTEKLLEEMESSMMSGKSDYTKSLDLQSFADWFVFNEILRNEEAISSDAYMVFSPDNILSMGPIWDMSKTMGGEYGDEYKNSILSETPWFSQLLKNSDFKKLVSAKVDQVVKNKKTIEAIIKERADAIKYSVAGNEMVWNSLGAQNFDYETVSEQYTLEVSKLSNWLDDRLTWIEENLK
ncbi:MAG: CotH kinase family protein [Paludibacteraceae bacterium]|nr:CotH kinase family protein [Paludibacteraceae bacterium]